VCALLHAGQTTAADSPTPPPGHQQLTPAPAARRASFQGLRRGVHARSGRAALAAAVQPAASSQQPARCGSPSRWTSSRQSSPWPASCCAHSSESSSQWCGAVVGRIGCWRRVCGRRRRPLHVQRRLFATCCREGRRTCLWLPPRNGCALMRSSALPPAVSLHTRAAFSPSM
jgi:hypothetical protein